MANTIELTLEVDDKGSAVVKRFSGNVVDKVKHMSTVSSGHVSKLQSVFNKLGGAIGGLGKRLLSLKSLAIGALAGWGFERLAGGFIETASSMDKLKMSLDTITKGRGEEWFEKLNEWALKMPVNTEKAIESFIMMRAMGLEPTIQQMTTLVDTTSALGGGADTLQGIARALGQIATKGKVSAEELMQLAERGVPVFEILEKKFGKVEIASLDAKEAIAAIFEGLEERFGGQSERIQKKWSGLVETLKSYWKEFKRLVMESGVMKTMEDILGRLVEKIDELKKSGKLEEWARKVGVAVTNVIATVVEAIGQVPKAFYQVIGSIREVMAALSALGTAAIDVCAFVAASLHPAWAVKVAGKGLEGKDLGTALREVFPTLAEYRDKLAEIGQSQYDAGQEARKTAEKFAGFETKLKEVADQIRNSAETAQKEKIVAKPSVETERWEYGLKLVEGTYVAFRKKVEEPVSPSVDTGPWKYGLELVEGSYVAFRKKVEEQPVKSVVEFVGEHSPEKPLSEAVEDVKGWLGELTGTAWTATVNLGGDILSGLESAWKRLKSITGKVWKAVVDFVGKGSTEKPLGEKLAEIEEKMKEFSKTVEDQEPKLKVDASQAVGQIDFLSCSYQDFVSLVVNTQAVVKLNTAAAMQALTALEQKYARMVATIRAKRAERMAWGPEFMSPEQLLRSYRREQRLIDIQMAIMANLRRYSRQYSVGSYQTGTGPEGLPYTGLFYGHKREIVLSPEESATIRGLTGLSREVRGSVAIAGSRGVRGSVKIENLTISVPESAAPQRPEDWRYITREFIRPELEKLN